MAINFTLKLNFTIADKCNFKTNHQNTRFDKAMNGSVVTTFFDILQSVLTTEQVFENAIL